MPEPIISPIANNESGYSVRSKLNQLISGVLDGSLLAVKPEDLEELVDTIAPGKPATPDLSSVALPAPVLTISWNANLEEDLAYYDVQIKKGTGNWLSYPTSAEEIQISVTPNTGYSVRLFAIDASGNRSPSSDVATITTARDEIAPATPIGISVATGIGIVWLSWTPNSESDLARYEVYESDTTDEPSDEAEATYSSTAASFVRAGLGNEVTRYYWIRAVDTSGNASPWSARKDATTSPLPEDIKFAVSGITFQANDPTADSLTWTAGSISYGRLGDAPTTKAIDAGSAEWASGTLYVYYVPGDTALSSTSSLVTMYAAGGILCGVYQGGTAFQLVAGDAYVDGGKVLAQTIGANQLVTDQAVITGTAQIADAIITNAKIVTLDVIKLTASTIASNNALIGLVNGANVNIDPGRITVSGDTTLADWRYGGDTTLINGGVIAANTILANSAIFGQRSLGIEGLEFKHNDPATNKVSWTAGTITYVGDDGNVATRNITASNATWSSGTLYIYYTKGATTLSTTTSTVTAYSADNAILAAYRGGADLVANYGRTIIDGGKITGIMAAFDTAAFNTMRTNILTANSITSTMIAAGSIYTRHLVISDSDNLIPDNQFQDALAWTTAVPYWTLNTATVAEVNSIGCLTYTKALDAGTGYSGPIGSATNAYFPVVAGKSYYLEERIGADGNAQVLTRIFWYDETGVALTPGFSDQFNTVYPTGYTTASREVVAPAGAKKARITWYIYRDTTAATQVVIGGVIFRKKNGGELLVDGSITAAALDVDELSAITSNVGTLTAGVIQNVSGTFVINLDDGRMDIYVP